MSWFVKDDPISSWDSHGIAIFSKDRQRI